jgi:transposase-like protein
MERRKFSREFKLEAMSLVRDRGVAVAQAAQHGAGESHMTKDRCGSVFY